METVVVESEVFETTRNGIEILLTELKEMEDNSDNVESCSMMKDDVTDAIESLCIADTQPEYFNDSDPSTLVDNFNDTKSEVSSIGQNQQLISTIEDPKAIMNQIKNLRCLFTWNIKPNNENNLIVLIQNKFGEYNLNICSSEFTLERYVGNLIIAYELFHKNEPELAQMKLLEIQNWLEELDKGTDEFYLSIKIGLQHVTKATFIHMLYATNLIEECKWILNDVVLYSHMNFKSRATIHAICAAVLTEYGANNMIYLKNACNNAKIASNRQFSHKSNPTKNEINAINQAVMLSNGKNVLFNYHQLILCRYDIVRNTIKKKSLIKQNLQHKKCVYIIKNIISMDPKDPLLIVKCARILMTLPIMALDFNLGKQCLIKAFEMASNDETVLKAISEAVNAYYNNIKPKTTVTKPNQPPPRIKRSKLGNDLRFIMKKHMNGEDPVPYLTNLVSKYDGLEQSIVIAQLCSYTILFTDNLKFGIEQFIKLIEQPGIANNDIITKHTSSFGSQKFNLSELIYNEIRLATNLSGTSTEDILYYYKILAKIMETCNLEIKDIDSSMKAKLIADSSVKSDRYGFSNRRVQCKTKSVNKNNVLKNKRSKAKKVNLRKVKIPKMSSDGYRVRLSNKSITLTMQSNLET
ncbi:uncharacterized protein LOC113557156 isoform X2 [Rhopalosiphum maidis]|uniref:uncharacterized protein LOC113557156 isoform X2 n=1 Tax=Rhopalosiphum maidis TaxID=43146 RepID=UPI000EFEAC43|nr:uncharacterized protein LOC113557156 isoform X2 [Rhopalosiphum maidis]